LWSASPSTKHELNDDEPTRSPFEEKFKGAEEIFVDVGRWRGRRR
jgi:hypothetical protein